jgi:iron complex transport system ATP-binding protein
MNSPAQALSSQAVATAAPPTAMELRSVDFSYPAHGGQPAMSILRQINLSIPPGQLWCVLGPNGSGKTTLLRLMAGLLNPAGGLVLLEGISLSRMSNRSLARRLALVPQETQPAFDYTVLQVVLMGRSPHMGTFGFDRRVDLVVARDCMNKTDTLRLEHRPFDELSSGERQRVVIARALAQKPHVLLLDEPTAFLDIGHQLQVYRLLRQLTAEGMTVVCVSHDLNVAALYADQLVLLHGGEIVAAGPAEQVLTTATIRQVYQVDVDVMPHPATGRPVVLPAR